MSARRLAMGILSLLHCVPHRVLLSVLLCGTSVSAAEVRIGAAANLRGTLDALVERYAHEHADPHDFSITFGSTAKLYAQIVHGAPFDLFFSADREHAEKLEGAGLTVEGTRFTYAIGRLVLWSPRTDATLPAPPDSTPLEGADLRHLAMANPRLAPYGRAAREFLETRELWDDLEPRIVYGEDAGKAFHFLQSGAAEWGFIPFSLVKQSKNSGYTWMVPNDLYDPIEQQAAQLRPSEAAASFLDFVRSESARSLLVERGYALP